MLGVVFSRKKNTHKASPYDRYKWSYNITPIKWPKINGFFIGENFHPEIIGVKVTL